MGAPWQHTMALEAPHVSAAIRYVAAEQGDATSVFEAQYS